MLHFPVGEPKVAFHIVTISSSQLHWRHVCFMLPCWKLLSIHTSMHASWMSVNTISY